ncbi:MAG TPA: ornithine cyclodeaminase family protein [Kofleriaceae bacterium]|nr:ornithine cyclodeaminase family protein [Kofleriaceae bacterium]
MSSLSTGELLILSLEDVVACGGADMVAGAADTRRGFGAFEARRACVPPKCTLQAPGAQPADGLVNALGAFVREDDDAPGLYGVKLFGSMFSNVERGIPRGTGLLVLFDPDTKVPVCMLDAQVISATRTGAVTLLAAGALASPETTEVGLIGAGVNMRTQLVALRHALPALRRARVYSRGDSKRAFADEMSRALELEIAPVDSVAAAVEGMEVVVTCTPITHDPVVRSEWLRPRGLTLFNIGACEFEPELMASMDRVVVDSWPHALHRGLQPPVVAVRRGLLAEERVEDLAPILSGTSPGRTGRDQAIFFSPVGLAFSDVLIAWRIYREALARGVGQPVRLWSSSWP